MNISKKGLGRGLSSLMGETEVADVKPQTISGDVTIAISKLKPSPEITRFKGLGEISPNEFKHFIGDNIRLDPIMLDEGMSIEDLLSFYMGKNTPDRQNFIIDNLKVELDLIDNKK